MHLLFFSDTVEGYSTGSTILGGGGGGGGGNSCSYKIGASLVYCRMLLFIGAEK